MPELDRQIAAQSLAQDPNKHVGIDEDSRPASAYHDSPVAKALGGIWLDFRKPLGNIQFIVDNYGFTIHQKHRTDVSRGRKLGAVIGAPRTQPAYSQIGIPLGGI